MIDRTTKDAKQIGLLQDMLTSRSEVVVGVVDGGGVDGLPGGSEHSDDGISIAGLAAVHEYGLGVPERAPLRKTFDEIEGRLGVAAQRLFAQMVDGHIAKREMLGTLGLFASSQVRRTIQAGVEPPNAPATIKRKGSSKPLIDEGILLSAYTHEVRE